MLDIIKQKAKEHGIDEKVGVEIFTTYLQWVRNQITSLVLEVRLPYFGTFVTSEKKKELALKNYKEKWGKDPDKSY